MFIPFDKISGSQKIFTDYIYHFKKVDKFFTSNFSDKNEYLKVFKIHSEKKSEAHNKIADIIKEQYNNLNASETTIQNINSLKDKETLAIVTGQQLGIIGGPLYTFYKIITAIKLSNYLNEKYDNYNFVPIFWLEGDDHDFEEIRSINLINSNNETVKISYNDGLPEDAERGSIGTVPLKETINKFFDDVNLNLRNSEFKEQILSQLRNIYSPGKTFNQSFKELIFWIFDCYGLIIFDPQDVRTKELLVPVFKKEIKDFRQHLERLISVSAELEEEYHAQVKVHPLNLFYSIDGGRYSIVPDENIFKLKRKRKKFTYDEIMREIDEHPENFSPNVLLRPICQDYLLPTVFYVGGPSEIAYFAQVNSLYDFYDIPHPIIYPRSSATILENNISSIIEKYNLDVKDLFTDLKSLGNKVIKSVSESSLDELFNEAENQVENALSKLKDNLFEIDKTMSDSSLKYKEKIISYIEELKGKALEAQKKKHEVTLRQIEKLSTHFYPNSNLQERELNFLYFAHKYGIDFIKKLFDTLEINQFNHQVINL
jgi:bacillithiol synthase